MFVMQMPDNDWTEVYIEHDKNARNSKTYMDLDFTMPKLKTDVSEYFNTILCFWSGWIKNAKHGQICIKVHTAQLLPYSLTISDPVE